jgi:ketosteroid isomerase-like protein
LGIEIQLMNEADTLRDVLAAINAAWTSADISGLGALFHSDMVIVGPGYQQFAVGRDACIESYREFSSNASVLAYEASEATVHVWGDTAVCSYTWSMTWQRAEDPVSDVGTDQFVFARVGGQWLAVYRLVLFQSSQA